MLMKISNYSDAFTSYDASHLYVVRVVREELMDALLDLCNSYVYLLGRQVTTARRERARPSCVAAVSTVFTHLAINYMFKFFSV